MKKRDSTWQIGHEELQEHMTLFEKVLDAMAENHTLTIIWVAFMVVAVLTLVMSIKDWLR